MVIAILVNRFAPSSRGLRRAEPADRLQYEYYMNQQLNIHGNIKSTSRKKLQLVVNSRGKRAWKKIRNATKASKAFRQSIFDSTSEEEADYEDTISSVSSEKYDDYYFSLSGRQKEQQEDTYDNQHPQIDKSERSERYPNNNFSTMNRNSRQRMKTSHRKKKIKAISFVTSIASDMDLIADWFFFHSAVKSNRQYMESLNSNTINNDDTGKYQPDNLIPPILIRLSLISCILGTCIWLVLATDGRIIAPVCRLFGVDSLSMGVVLFLCILVEDIPQIILTFLIEEYYEEGRSLSNYAVCNIIVSFYDIIIKFAEAYDERHDFVETGVWCKASIRAHTDTITSVVSLPPSHDDWKIPSKMEHNNDHHQSNCDNPKLNKQLIDFNAIVETETSTPYYTNMSAIENRSKMNLHNQQSIAHLSTATTTRKTIPRTRILTTSLDGTIRLWDTDYIPEDLQRNSCSDIRQHRYSSDACVKVFRQSADSITCISLLGTCPSNRHGHIKKNANDESSSSSHHEKIDQVDTTNDIIHDTYFITGSRKGVTSLWNLNTTQSITEFKCKNDNYGSVNCIEVIIEGETFITAYEKGVVLLWDVWSGTCIACYHGHYGTNNIPLNTVCCSLDDGVRFITGAADKCLHLWNTSNAMKEYRIIQQEQHLNQPTIINEQHNDHNNTTTRLNRQVQNGIVQEQLVHENGASALRKYFICEKKFEGHNDKIECICCIEPSKAFVSGSSDGTARLWSVQTGRCLQIYTGHSDSITTIQAVDHVTFLTGSKDTTIRLWDIISGTSIRIYHGHTSAVTDVSVTADDKSFVTTSTDMTIKVWVITAVQDELSTNKHVDGGETDHNDSIMYDGLCRGLEPL